MGQTQLGRGPLAAALPAECHRRRPPFWATPVVSQERYLAISAALGVLLSLGAYLSTGYVSVGFIAALGFANAMMWPAIFPLAIKGLGRQTETGSALLIMAIAGGAILPYVFALMKQHIDFQLAYLALAVPSYLYILYYGVRGYRLGQGAGNAAVASSN